MNKYRPPSVINSSKPYNIDVLTSYLEDPFVWKDKEPASIKAEERRRRRGYSCVEKLRAFRIAKTHFSEHAFLTSDFFNIGSLTCKLFPLLKIVAFPFFVGRTTLLSLVFFLINLSQSPQHPFSYHLESFHVFIRQTFVEKESYQQQLIRVIFNSSLIKSEEWKRSGLFHQENKKKKMHV